MTAVETWTLPDRGRVGIGTATSIVETAKKVLPAGVRPTTNMWCAHTPRLMKPIDTVAATMNG